jgi:glycosyltransferase 2 family protein
VNTKKNNFNYKKILNFIGYFIACMSLFYIFWMGFKQWQIIKELFRFQEKLPGIIISTLIYTILISLVSSMVWKKIITGFGGKISFKESFVILGRSQIAKYIPGNVFQYFGRHLLTKDLGISNGIVINSIFVETALFILSAIIIFITSSLMYGYKNYLFTGINNYLLLISIIITVVIFICLVIFILIKFIPKIKNLFIKHNLLVELRTIDLKKLWYHITISLILFLIFFLSTGCILWLLNRYLWIGTEGSAVFFIGAYSISWVTGFITPGASGGIGVREAILISLLSPYTSHAKALVLAIVLRLVTIFGDLLFFLATYILRIMKKKMDKINV